MRTKDFLLQVKLYREHQAGKSYYQIAKENDIVFRTAQRWIKEAQEWERALGK